MFKRLFTGILSSLILSGTVSAFSMQTQRAAPSQERANENARKFLEALVDTPRLKRLLDAGADPNLRLITEKSHSDMAFSKGMSALMFAVFLGQAEAVQLLLDHGAKTEMGDENGWTALMWSAAGNSPPGTPSAGSRLVPILVEHGAKTEAVDHDGMTALMIAAHFLHSEVADALLKKGASVNAANKKGETPLLLAVNRASGPDSSRQAIATIKVLLQAGADPNRKDNHGESAITLANRSASPEIKALVRTGKLPEPSPRTIAAPKQDLLAQSQPVLKVKPPVFEYWWLSNRQVLVPEQVAKSQDIQTIYVQYDVATKSQKRNAYLKSFPVPIELSRDVKWALYYDNQSAQTTWIAIALNQPKTVKVPVTAALQKTYIQGMIYEHALTWLPDSRHWVWIPSAHIDANLHAFVYSLDQPKTVRSIKITLPHQKQTIARMTFPDWLLGFLPNGHALSISSTARVTASDHIDLFEFGLDRPAAMARGYTVHLPVKAKATPLLSLQGDRLLWVLQTEGETEDVMELWCSRADGSAMKVIGTISLTQMASELVRSSVRWLPDGNQASFIYEGKLWTTPVPRN